MRWKPNVGCGRGVGQLVHRGRTGGPGRVYPSRSNRQIKLVNDPVVNGYVTAFGQNLVRNSDAQVPFTIKVIDSDVVECHGAAGGFFYVNSGRFWLLTKKRKWRV